MKGPAWGFPTGITPFGNCQYFLYKNQITPTKVLGKPSQHNYHAIVSDYSICLDTRVNFVMNPIKSYPNPFAEIFNESQVEKNLGKMFDVNSLGIYPQTNNLSVIMIKGKLKNLKTSSNSEVMQWGKNHDLLDLRVAAFCTFQLLKRKNKKAKMATHSRFLYLLSLALSNGDSRVFHANYYKKSTRRNGDGLNRRRVTYSSLSNYKLFQRDTTFWRWRARFSMSG